MLGSDRPFMVTTTVGMDEQTGRQGRGFGKMRAGYGKPTPRIGSREASGLDGRITSISRTLYPYHQTENQGSDGYYDQGSSTGYYGQSSDRHYGQGSYGHYDQGSNGYYGQGSDRDYDQGSNRHRGQGSNAHYGAFYSESSSGSHSHSASYSATSPSAKQYSSSYGQWSYTETRESHNSKKGSVQSVRDTVANSYM